MGDKKRKDAEVEQAKCKANELCSCIRIWNTPIRLVWRMANDYLHAIGNDCLFHRDGFYVYSKNLMRVSADKDNMMFASYESSNFNDAYNDILMRAELYRSEAANAMNGIYREQTAEILATSTI